MSDFFTDEELKRFTKQEGGKKVSASKIGAKTFKGKIHGELRNLFSVAEEILDREPPNEQDQKKPDVSI